MNPIDFVVIILLLIGFIWGFNKGFIYMIFSLLAILGGIFGASKLAPLLITIFPAQYNKMGYIILFMLFFIIIYFVIKKLTYLLEDMIEFLELEWLDSLLGGIIGLFQFLIIIGVIINIGNSSGFFQFIPSSHDTKIAFFISDISQRIIGFLAGNLSAISSLKIQ